MAVALFKHEISTREDAGQWRVESAGTWASEGMGPAYGTIMILKERGLSLPKHRSRIVTEEMIDTFDLVLTMESGQKEALRIEFPEAAKRIFMVSEMIGRLYDIPDPMNGSWWDYHETANDLDYIFSNGMERIVQLARPQTG